MQNKLTQYPRINLRSKNDLAKRISDKNFTINQTRVLINDVQNNFDKYWHDNEKVSKPKEDKYVRSAAGTKLGKLLDLINKKILTPNDNLLPPFIFGGISNKDHVKAAINLLGKKNGRVFYKIDLKHFFEQIPQESVFLFFRKSGCSRKISTLLSRLLCVPEGKKGNKDSKPVLARGFSTSPRLAVWCNLHTFRILEGRVKSILKKHDFRISIYVDDIGISASRVDLILMNKALNLSRKIIETGNLKINEEKTILPELFSKKLEYLGLMFGRNGVYLNKETQKKLAKMRAVQHKDNCPIKIKKTLKGLKNYKNYVNRLNKSLITKT